MNRDDARKILICPYASLCLAVVLGHTRDVPRASGNHYSGADLYGHWLFLTRKRLGETPGSLSSQMEVL